VLRTGLGGFVFAFSTPGYRLGGFVRAVLARSSAALTAILAGLASFARSSPACDLMPIWQVASFKEAAFAAGGIAACTRVRASRFCFAPWTSAVPSQSEVGCTAREAELFQTISLPPLERID
jgi:hypothetical protein